MPEIITKPKPSRRGLTATATDYVWTPESISVLTKLWADGLSATQIAAAMPGNPTRNAVLGKVHRIGLPARLSRAGSLLPAKREPHGNKGQPKANAIVAKLAARREGPANPIGPQFGNRSHDVEPFDMEDGDGVDVSQLVGILENTGCKWVHGNPLGAHGYCGKPIKAGSKAWCPAHHARVYSGASR